MMLSFAPDRIEMWPLAKLQPYTKNAKAHGADQVAKIAASMAEFGWTVPFMVADDGEVIAGNGRVLAAKQLRLTARRGFEKSKWPRLVIRKGQAGALPPGGQSQFF